MAIDTRNKRASTVHLPWTTWPTTDSSVDAPDRAQFTGYYSGLTYTAVVVVTVSKTRLAFEIELYDKNGDLKKILTKTANVNWEYNRVGGCGQADVEAVYPLLGTFDRSILPGDELRIKIRNELRYSGKLLRVNRAMTTSDERLGLLFYGYSTELNDRLVQDTYEGMEVSEIVKDILDTQIVGSTKITYDTADIQVTDYAVQSITFNHSAMDAIVLLANLAGNVEWGVDRNKKFFFKTRDPEVRRAYIIGREVYEYQETEDQEAVKNFLNVYGQNTALLASVQDLGSQSIYGVREDNIFESSISEQSDAARYGAVQLKNLSLSQRQIKFKTRLPDAFVETTTPLGATAVATSEIPVKFKYGTYKKYGRNAKYGNFKRDQIRTISYRITEGGLDQEISLSGDIPNLGSQQKRIEFEIKELQRR